MCMRPHTVQQSPLPLSNEAHIHLLKYEPLLPCKHVVTWSQGLAFTVYKVISPVSKNITARYIYGSWLTPAIIAGSVGSEDQRGWRRGAKWNCPNLPSLLSLNSKSQIILLPRGMIENEEGKNSELDISS